MGVVVGSSVFVDVGEGPSLTVILGSTIKVGMSTTLCDCVAQAEMRIAKQTAAKVTCFDVDICIDQSLKIRL
jgi:hypothetical protein